jgi:SAM-dependent methyltransferase
MAGSQFSWVYLLPRVRPVDRDAYVLDRCSRRRVLHLGFVDEHLTEEKVAADRWLHARISRVAGELIGVDVAVAGVAWARERGYRAEVADIQDERAVRALGLEQWADVVVAGEVIEHLEAPGFFLRAVSTTIAPGGVLIVTTPNAYRAANFVVAAIGRELIHPDHTGWHSPRTLRVLGERAGYRVLEELYYQHGTEGRGDGSPRWRAARSGKRVLNGFCRWRPFFSDGLITVYQPESTEGLRGVR